MLSITLGLLLHSYVLCSEPNTAQIIQCDHNSPPKPKRVIVTGPKAWALACSGVLVERNSEYHDSLELVEARQFRIHNVRKMIDQWWGITDRDTFYETLQWVENEGHRADFEKYGQALDDMSFFEIIELSLSLNRRQEKLQKVNIAFEYYNTFGQKSLLGWDLSRAIYITRAAYTVGYITKDEAWEIIMHDAQELQDTFESWADLGQNFIIGRQFWSYEQTQKTGEDTQNARDRLLEMPSSPWRQLDWNMELPKDSNE